MALRVVLGLLAGLVFLLPCVAESSDFRVDEKGISKTWSDPKIRLQIGGRFHADLVRSPEDLFGDHKEIRRARIDAGLRVGDHWRFKIDREFAGNQDEWRNLWVRYANGKWRVTLGQFVTPFSQGAVSESNNTVFIERSLPSALAPSFRSGVAVTHTEKKWSLTAAAMGNPIHNRSQSDDGVSVVARGVFNPIRTSEEVVHLAAAAEHRQLDDDASLRLSSRHEVSLRDRSLLRNRRIRSANNYTNFNIEGGYRQGPTLLLAQFLARQTQTDRGNRFSSGGSIQLSYVIGSASRRYSRRLGTFGAVVPKADYGALELSGRISHLRIGDVDEKVGHETAASVGLSWFINRNVRVSVNSIYSVVDIENRNRQRSGFSQQARFQIAF